MASQVKEISVKAPRKKTPAQLAKIAANKAAYDERNAKLARLHAAANTIRQQYCFKGTDEQVFAQHAQHVASFARQRALERAQYVADALNGPSAALLLKGLSPHQPTYERVVRFFTERPSLQRVYMREAA